LAAETGLEEGVQEHSWRRRVHEIIESGFGVEPLATMIHGLLVALVCLNVAAFAAATIPEVGESHGSALRAFNLVAAGVFLAEYVLRLWSCVELPFLSHMGRGRARWLFANQLLQVIDVLAFAPAIATFIVGIDFSAAIPLSFLKVARYSTPLQSLGHVLASERGPLFGALLAMITLLLVASSVMYFLERDAQPRAFRSIPDAVWWALITLATIGYGYVVPVTPLGKLFTSIFVLFGLTIFALPIGIIVSGFAQDVSRREFMITWHLVARIPLFSGLQATAVSQIMTLLQSRSCQVGEEIVRRGEEGNCMYIIASGEVIVELDDGEARLGEGEFFGEMSLLDRRPRSHNVVAAKRCRLLMLEREDLENLGRRHPEILRRVREVAARRRSEVATAPSD
jgi:voltage-gated potassium channel